MHTTDVKVRFNELDAYGHVNHAVYLTYFETARIEALAECGFDLARLKREGFHLVVVDLHARYARPAMLGDLLTVETQITEVRPASSRWRQRITRDGELIAAVDLRGAVTDLEGNVRRVPEEFVASLAALRPESPPNEPLPRGRASG